MAPPTPEEVTTAAMTAAMGEARNQGRVEDGTDHPYAFHVSGPRKLPSPSWREIFNSSWKDGRYRRTVIACLIQGVYLLELDRQERRGEGEGGEGLAPKWWTPFKYRLVEKLRDERDGSVYGAVLEWDRASALADLILMRPSGAPRAVLVLRGTILKGPTIRRDVEDDLRFLARESLRGSVRYSGALHALNSIVDKHGGVNVCVAGHSLGAGFALQIGKAVAEMGVFVETHLFNPPSVSIATGFRGLRQKAGLAWKRLRSPVPDPLDTGNRTDNDGGADVAGGSGTSRKWAPHLYVNDSDYICCYYSGGGPDLGPPAIASTGGTGQGGGAKLFVTSKGKQRFLEAHALEQWWADDVELTRGLVGTHVQRFL